MGERVHQRPDVEPTSTSAEKQDDTVCEVRVVAIGPAATIEPDRMRATWVKPTGISSA